MGGCLEFLEVFLHESKTNLIKPASELKILIMINAKAHVYRELHYIHIALLFSPNIQMFYLKRNVDLSFYFLSIRGKLGEGACDSVNKLFFPSTPTLSWGSIYANVQYLKYSFCPSVPQV